MAKDTRRPSYQLTFEDAVKVWMMFWDGWFQNRIAAHFDVNPARISEVLKGKRQPVSREVAMRQHRKSA
jgi:plasmid maintenance system antidote protein VapI